MEAGVIRIVSRGRSRSATCSDQFVLLKHFISDMNPALNTGLYSTEESLKSLFDSFDMI